MVVEFKRIRNALAYAMVVSLTLSAHAFGAESEHPKAEVLERRFSFGTVPEGSRVRHDFTIKNSGSSDLVIQRVIPQCGCTASRVDKLLVTPGDKATLTVEFDTAGFPGKREKSVKVLTNDPESLTSFFTLSGEVLEDISVSPSSVDLGKAIVSSLKNDSSKRGEVTITVRSGSGTKILKVRTTSDSVVAEVIEQSASTWRVKVRPAEHAQLGEIHARLVISTSARRASVVTVPIIGEIISPIEVVPPVISFGLIEGSAPIERRVKLSALGGHELHIGQVQTDSSALSSRVIEIAPNSAYVLVVALDPTKIQLSRDFISAVRISTDGEPLVISAHGVRGKNG